MTSAVVEYNLKVPELMRKAVEGFAKPEGRAIVMLLTEKDELSFKKLASKPFGILESEANLLTVTIHIHTKNLLVMEVSHYSG